jgi:hypothetical protein
MVSRVGTGPPRWGVHTVSCASQTAANTPTHLWQLARLGVDHGAPVAIPGVVVAAIVYHLTAGSSSQVEGALCVCVHSAHSFKESKSLG